MKLPDAPRAGVQRLMVVALAVVRRSPLTLDWGAYVASGLGVMASIGSGMLLTHRGAQEGLNR